MKSFWRKCKKVFSRKKRSDPATRRQRVMCDVQTETCDQYDGDRSILQDINDRLPGTPSGGMSQQLTCPVCLDLYSDPVLLPCLHSLCRNCAEALKTYSSTCRCPECRQPIGRELLRNNFHLNNIVKTFQGAPESRKGKRDILALNSVEEDPQVIGILQVAKTVVEPLEWSLKGLLQIMLIVFLLLGFFIFVAFRHK